MRPDTYIELIKSVTQDLFVLDVATPCFERQDVTFTPGLYKIFQEILVNPANNNWRNPDMDRLKVTVDAKTNTISVLDNGIPVVMHKEHDCYIPTLIFGHLLTGYNFDDTKKKTTDGRNG